MFKRPLLMLALSVALLTQIPARAAIASPEDDVRATFNRFVAAQNAHDLTAVGALLWNSDDFLWITRGAAIFGRSQALSRFQGLYAGTWQLTPAGELRVTMLAPDVAEVYVPVDFNIGSSGAPPVVTRFLFNQTLIKRSGGWFIASILPIPVPPPVKP